MPDIPTVATSIGLTLGIQGLYFIYVKLPSQLRRCLGTLDRLKNRETAENRIYENVRKEGRLALGDFADWEKQLSACKSLAEGRTIDRSYFQNALPMLTTRLGRLQGMLTAYTSKYSTDPLPDFIWLFEQARRISKFLGSYKNLSEIEFDFELSDIELVLSRVGARVEQMSHEVDILQTDLHLEVSNLEAEIGELKTRFVAVSIFFGISISFATDYLAGKYFHHMGLKQIYNSVLSVLCAWLLLLAIYWLSRKYYSYVVKGIQRIKLQEDVAGPESPRTLMDKSGSES